MPEREGPRLGCGGPARGAGDEVDPRAVPLGRKRLPAPAPAPARLGGPGLGGRRGASYPSSSKMCPLHQTIIIKAKETKALHTLLPVLTIQSCDVHRGGRRARGGVVSARRVGLGK